MNMENKLIQWPKAKYWEKQWNPVIGCKPCSPACEHCYAAAWAKRFGQSFEPHNTKQKPPRSGIVFCGNMCDIFGEWRYFEDMVYDVQRPVGSLHSARYLWLTKRVANMSKVLAEGVAEITYIGRDPDASDTLRFSQLDMSNHYFGFTAENQQYYDSRLKVWRDGAPRWAKGWLSAEPLLGPIDLGFRYIAPEDMPFKWVVVGCESGPNRRPCQIEWVEAIVEECRSAGVPVFVKQICLPNGKFTNSIEEFPANLQIRQVPWIS